MTYPREFRRFSRSKHSQLPQDSTDLSQMIAVPTTGVQPSHTGSLALMFDALASRSMLLILTRIQTVAKYWMTCSWSLNLIGSINPVTQRMVTNVKWTTSTPTTSVHNLLFPWRHLGADHSPKLLVHQTHLTSWAIYLKSAGEIRLLQTWRWSEHIHRLSRH